MPWWRLSRARFDGLGVAVMPRWRQVFACFGHDRFGMELDAFDIEFFVANSHDDAIFGVGSDFERVRDGVLFDCQRVIANGLERLW